MGDPSAMGALASITVAQAREDQTMHSFLDAKIAGGKQSWPPADARTIWMRVDRAPGSAIRFDNMMTRKANGALKGTNGWTERSIVLEVPDEATSIHYGFFLQGYGRVWAKSLRLAIAEQHTRPTAGPGAYLPKPTNLDFSRTE
jgi:hypothetical protein